MRKDQIVTRRKDQVLDEFRGVRPTIGLNTGPAIIGIKQLRVGIRGRWDRSRIKSLMIVRNIQSRVELIGPNREEENFRRSIVSAGNGPLFLALGRVTLHPGLA